jgi:flagellar protein FliS
MNDAYKKYKKTEVESASKEKVLLLLYEAAMKFIKKAILAAEAKDIAERGYNIGRAFDIVNELSNSLNHDVGGEVTKNLERLYMFVTDQFVQANISGNPKPLKDALKVIEILYQGWVQAIEKVKKDNKGNKDEKEPRSA